MSWFDDLIDEIGHLWDEFVDFLGWLVNKVVDSIRGWISEIAEEVDLGDFFVTKGHKSKHIDTEDFSAQFSRELEKHGKTLVDIQRNGQEIEYYRRALAAAAWSHEHTVPMTESEKEQWKETAGKEQRILQVSSS